MLVVYLHVGGVAGGKAVVGTYGVAVGAVVPGVMVVSGGDSLGVAGVSSSLILKCKFIIWIENINHTYHLNNS